MLLEEAVAEKARMEMGVEEDPREETESTPGGNGDG